MTQFQPKDAERATITLKVRTLDRAPMHGTGGELVPIAECDPKGVAAKLLEEAAEAYGAWQIYANTDTDFMRELTWGPQLADELADVITAACDLAKVCGLDLQAALDRNECRQIERGRIDG